ncbi:hypothetical protein NDN08_007871 [Rhodosorus marinus]|uniref:RING-type domain-containing protein n=1 Tax=Rhodosorus marinus TaxID=101924 RepID=A0AAV8V424_9RHOD|nr:hypothetical protein NDN08_007871 [Rhodosorus marinus]
MEVSKECNICWEAPVREEQAMVSVCKHLYCTSCIVSWGLVNPTCPLCRKTFNSLLVRRTAEGSLVLLGNEELGWVEESLLCLQAASRVKLKEVEESPGDDLYSTGNFQLSDQSVSLTSLRATVYRPTTAYQDHLEAQVFQDLLEEEEFYHRNELRSGRHMADCFLR